MAGRKNIALLDELGRPIHFRFRYKKVRSAVRKAVEVSIQNRIRVQVWHLDRGQEVALVRSGKWGVGIDTPHPNTFIQLWSAE